MSERFPRDTAKRKLREEDWRRATAHGQRLAKWEYRKEAFLGISTGLLLGAACVTVAALSIWFLTNVVFSPARSSASIPTPTATISVGKVYKAIPWTCRTVHTHDYVMTGVATGECRADNSNQDWGWR